MGKKAKKGGLKGSKPAAENKAASRGARPPAETTQDKANEFFGISGAECTLLALSTVQVMEDVGRGEVLDNGEVPEPVRRHVESQLKFINIILGSYDKHMRSLDATEDLWPKGYTFGHVGPGDGLGRMNPVLAIITWSMDMHAYSGELWGAILKDRADAAPETTRKTPAELAAGLFGKDSDKCRILFDPPSQKQRDLLITDISNQLVYCWPETPEHTKEIIRQQYASDTGRNDQIVRDMANMVEQMKTITARGDGFGGKNAQADQAYDPAIHSTRPEIVDRHGLPNEEVVRNWDRDGSLRRVGNRPQDNAAYYLTAEADERANRWLERNTPKERVAGQKPTMTSDGWTEKHDRLVKSTCKFPGLSRPEQQLKAVGDLDMAIAEAIAAGRMPKEPKAIRKWCKTTSKRIEADIIAADQREARQQRSASPEPHGPDKNRPRGNQY